MTRSPHRPPLAYRDIDDVARALREAGGRFSAARRRVLEALFEADVPLPADAVAPGLDRASVYRARSISGATASAGSGPSAANSASSTRRRAAEKRPPASRSARATSSMSR